MAHVRRQEEQDRLAGTRELLHHMRHTESIGEQVKLLKKDIITLNSNDVTSLQAILEDYATIFTCPSVT